VYEKREKLAIERQKSHSEQKVEQVTEVRSFGLVFAILSFQLQVVIMA
jgi:hypothetical protein